MTKFHYCLLATVLLFLSGCQSVEPLSIDYMLPAEVSFPATLKRVAVVNNMPAVPDNKLIVSEEEKVKSTNEMARMTNYYNGDASLAAESLAKALAEENYFEEVVICDSALRTKDIHPRESTLSTEEVNVLVRNLDVDFLIALENVQIRSIRKISYLPDQAAFLGTVDVKVYPTVKVYLPNRKGPMMTVNANDSIFWEEAGNGEAYVRGRLIKEQEMLKQASEFAGTIPVKYLLPHWETDTRYLFSGGSVQMRDGAVYAKEGNWPEAIALWQKTYDSKKGKQRIYAACNLALGHEMQDKIDTALEWALKAQSLTGGKGIISSGKAGEMSENMMALYLFISSYVSELQKRKEGSARLHMQMGRFGGEE